MIKFSKDKVLLLHKLIAQETGGSIGIRDEGLLESALEVAFSGFGDKEFYPSKEEKGARLGYHLISNHAFVDGNKRIGMYVMLNNGQTFKAGDYKKPFTIQSVVKPILLLLALTACHGPKVERTQEAERKDPSLIYQIPETFDTSRDYEITFWAKNDTNMTQVKIYQKAIADFEKLYPNIDVALSTSPSSRL